MQTSWAEKGITQALIKEMQKQELELTLEGIQVTLPLRLSFQKARVLLKNGDLIEIENAKIRLSLLSLLKRKLSVRFVSVDLFYYAFFEKQDTNTFSLSYLKDLSFALPFDLFAKTIRCKKISIENKSTQKKFCLQLSASAKIERSLKNGRFDLFLEEAETTNTFKAIGIISEKKEHCEAIIDMTLSDYQNALSFFEAPDWMCPSIIHAKIALLPGFILSCEDLRIDGKRIDLQGEFLLSSDFTPLSGAISCFCPEIQSLRPDLPLSGEISIKAMLESRSFLASCSSPLLVIERENFSPISLEISAEKDNFRWKGCAKAEFSHSILPIQQSCLFTLDSNSLNISDFSFSCAETQIGGLGSYSFKDHLYKMSFFIMSGELKTFRLLFPQSELDGQLGGSISVQGNSEDLSIQSNLHLKGVRYQNSLIHTAHINADLEKLKSNPSGFLSCDLENVFFRDMLLSKVQLTSNSFSEEKQQFSAIIEGIWKETTRLESEGFWHKKGPLWEVNLGTCSGYFFKNSFSLEEPFTFGKNQDSFFIDSCSWKIGKGDLSFHCSLTDQEISLYSQGNHIPIDLLGVAYPKINFQGISSFQASLSGQKNTIQGQLIATLEEAEFLQNKAKGSLQIHINSLGAQIHSYLYGSKNQFLDLTATIPLNYSYNPFYWKIDEERPLSSELTMQGAIEEIFDFINASNHKISGWVTAHLFLSKNKKAPSLQGSINYSQGSYKNFASGTILNSIEGELIAKNNVLEIVRLQAFDEKKGNFQSKGSLFLFPEKSYPFEIEALLQNMHITHSDFIDSSVTGSILIKGNTNEATAKGDLTVDNALIQIFDDLPYEIPVLPVTYINKPITLKTQNLEQTSPYPLELSIELSTDETVLVKGKGLDSKWKGSVLLTGTPAHLSAKGSLALVQGEFLFSGKVFTLTQGEISFSDKPSPSAYLKIHGELQLSSVTILAQMQGPLSSPTLTFQSIPSLPTSSILSFILFNKDISEISALQALQLAQVFVSLSGNGAPDVLESIRKRIGIDKLNIIGKDGTDEISVQIGWYLSHGITLSLSQSATSSDVTIEVDLKNGFIFQAETQNQEEGKFSLKWNKNY